jgi:phage terminase large subunit GpA-like protein
MLAVTEPGVHVLTAMVCTQLMKTALIENIVGYHAHLDPCPMLLVQPKDEAVEAFSKERIGPLIKSTPVLRKLIGSKKTRSAEETLTYKAFPGGFLAMVGAGSPDNLARRPVRITLYDETDKYVVTREGDPIGLGDERQATFPNYLSVRACSPTIEGESRIETSFMEGDQRQASVACPHCGHRNFLEFFRHVEWHTDEDSGIHDPKSAAIHCEACGAAWSEGQRLNALATTRWHQTRSFLCCGHHQDPLATYEEAWKAPDADRAADPVAVAWDWWASDRHAVYRARCSQCGTWAVDNEHASFTAGKLFSPWPKDAPPKQAAKWLAAKNDPDQRVVFDNTQRGRPHKRHSSKDLKAEELAARAEHWAGEVPDGVGVITAGADTQDDRVEIEFVGWGANEESWTLGYVVVPGDTSSDAFWQEQVDPQLLRSFRRADGREFAIEAVCLDSGGHRTQEVYRFSKARLGRKVWAIKGASERSGQRAPVWPTVKPTNRTRAQFKPIVIGTNAAKDTVRARLSLTEPGPGYCHFHAKRELGWYEQLISERLSLKIVSGKRYTVWECPKGKANEAADVRVYAYAALQGLIHFGMRLNDVTEERSNRWIAPTAPEEPPAEGWGDSNGESWIGGGSGSWL